MTNSDIDAMERLGDILKRDHPGLTSTLTSFSSGSAMLDVHYRNLAFVMAYSPARGYAVDELGADDGFETSYRHSFSDFDSAAQMLHNMIATRRTTAEPASLCLIVLYSRNVEATKSFYSQLGIAFVCEQHGSGPTHYSTTFGSLVFEIYPCRDGQTNPPLRLGFHVKLLDATMALLRAEGAAVRSEPKQTIHGFRAVVEDPDGNTVELLSPPSSANATESAGATTIALADNRRPMIENTLNL